MISFKSQRVVLAERANYPGQYYAILVDWAYWLQYYDELIVWCAEYDAIVEGMTVEIPNKEAAMLFKMTWC